MNNNTSARFCEFEGKNINDAIKNAVETLNIQQDDLDIKHIDVFKTGIFQRTKKVRIQVQLTAQSQPNTTPKKKRKAEKMKNNACEEAVIDFITHVAKFTGNTVQVSIKERTDEQVVVSITGDDADNLVGKYGRNLLALQLLVSAMVRGRPEKNVMFFLDINDYWVKREEELRRLAEKRVSFAKRNNTEQLLPPLNSYERRLVYKILTGVSGVSVESIETSDPVLKQIRISPKSEE